MDRCNLNASFILCFLCFPLSHAASGSYSCHLLALMWHVLLVPFSRQGLILTRCSFLMQPFKLTIISNQQLCADFSGSGYACGLLQEINKVYSQPKLGFTLLLRMCNHRRLSRARNGTICAIIVCPAQELGGCGGTILRGYP